MMVDGGFAGLLHLLVSRNAEGSPILAEQGTCLLEMEGDIGINALLTNVKYPIVITDASIAARFSTNCHLFTPLSIPVHRGSGVSQRGKHSMKIYRAKQRLTYNFFVTNGQLTEYWQSLICASLILHRAADGDILIAIAPIFGQALPNPLGAFRYDVEIQVAPSLYHQPCLSTPFIGILDKEI